MRLSRLRTALLFGAGFLAGVTVGPASTLIGRQFERDLGVDTAFAQDRDRATERVNDFETAFCLV